MHWSGKLFIWLLLIAWIAAIPLVSKLMTIRNQWAADLTEKRIQNEKNADELALLRKKRSELQDDFATTTRGWGQTWLDIPVGNIDAQTGEMSIDLGRGIGLGLPDPDSGRAIVIHGFRPLPAPNDGEYEYIGPFRVKQLGDATSSVEPIFRVWEGLPGGQSEVASWGIKNGTLLRWREYVPTSANVDFNEYHKLLVKYGTTLADREREKASETASLVKHQQQLGTRTNELVGVPGGDPGLLDQIVVAESARNAELAAVDDLRRRIADAHAKQQELKAKALALEGRLPSAD